MLIPQVFTLTDGSEIEATLSTDDQGRRTVDLALCVNDTRAFSGATLTVHD